MRILLDEAGLGWDQAWASPKNRWPTPITRCSRRRWKKWPVAWFEQLLPRHLEIIFEINRRFLDEMRARFPGDEGRLHG